MAREAARLHVRDKRHGVGGQAVMCVQVCATMCFMLHVERKEHMTASCSVAARSGSGKPAATRAQAPVIQDRVVLGSCFWRSWVGDAASHPEPKKPSVRLVNL